MQVATSRLLTFEPRVGVNFCDTSSAMQRKGSASMRHELFECKFEVRREFGGETCDNAPDTQQWKPIVSPRFRRPKPQRGQSPTQTKKGLIAWGRVWPWLNDCQVERFARSSKSESIQCRSKQLPQSGLAISRSHQPMISDTFETCGPTATGKSLR